LLGIAATHQPLPYTMLINDVDPGCLGADSAETLTRGRILQRNSFSEHHVLVISESHEVISSRDSREPVSRHNCGECALKPAIPEKISRQRCSQSFARMVLRQTGRLHALSLRNLFRCDKRDIDRCCTRRPDRKR
jgi:hypothetical protein